MALQSAITVDPHSDIVFQRTITLTGTNSTEVKTIVVSAAGYITQPTSTTWRAEVKLVPGLNTIKISGTDRAGNTTATITVLITLPKLFDEQHGVHNPLDHFGIALSLERLPGEKNLPYRQRLLDVKTHPADATVIGLTYGAARELGIRVFDALTIKSPLDDRLGVPRAILGAIRVGSVYFDLSSPRLLFRECLTLEPATYAVTLKKTPKDGSLITVSTMQGDLVSVNDWAYDFKTNRLLFSNRDLEGKDLAIQYEYIERILLAGKTFRQLETDIEAIVDDNGRPLFLVTLIEPIWGPAADLISTSGFIAVTEDLVTLDKCQLRIRELHDLDFQASKLNSDNNALNTKLAAWVQRINTQTRIVWNATRLDESQWEPLGEDPGLGALPHLSDGNRGHWASLDPTDATKYTRKDFRRYEGVSPTTGDTLQYRGIEPLQFQSGTGTQNDLKVLKIVEAES